MPDVAFVMSPATHPLGDLVNALRAELGRAGVATSLHEQFPAQEPSRVYVLVSATDFVRELGEAALPGPGGLRRTLMLGAADAPRGDPPAAELELLRRAGGVFDLNQATVSTLHRYGIHARLLRPGYVPEWDCFQADTERPVDIAFFGADSPRRSRYLAQAAPVLARHESVIRIAEPGVIDGDERRELLARTKVMIDLHPGDGSSVDWLRMMDAMHAGAVFLTEQAFGFAPFDVGTHLISAAPEAIAWVAEALVRNSDRRNRLSVDAYERLRSWLPFAAPVAVLRAALLEMLGAPLDPIGDTP